MVRILDLSPIQQADIDSNDYLIISNVGGTAMASSRVNVLDFANYVQTGGNNLATVTQLNNAIDTNNALFFLLL